MVPIAGCSLELLDLLCQVIDAVHERQTAEHLSEAHAKLLQSLKIRLQGLVHHQSAVLPPDSTDEEYQHANQVAELYRLATMIYLLIVAKGDSIACSEVDGLVDEAFGILRKVERCQQPWPLFILGLAAHTEERRLIILTVIERALALQPLGSMALADRMIRDAWVQQDLGGRELDPLELYGQVISRNRVPPCFG